MAFMLGSFTNGMFSAMDDTNKFFKGMYENRETKAMAEGAEETAKQLKAQNGKGGALPAVTAGTGNVGSNGSSGNPDANLPGKINLDKDVPQPKHLASLTGPSAREHDNSAVPTTTPTQKPDMTAMPGESVPPAQAKPLSQQTLPEVVKPIVQGVTSVPGASQGAGGAPTGDIPGAWQGAPAPRQAAPTYLPPSQTRPSATNPSGGQPQTGFHAVFGANQAPGGQGVPTGQQPVGSSPMPGGPGTASPQMAAQGMQAPTLANGQSGLGAQLMASMNPQSGATA